MSAVLTAADRRLLIGAGAIVVAVVATALFFVRGTRANDGSPSSYATGSSGTKAAFLLLQRLGYDVARWEQPPAELLNPAATTLILAEPFTSPTPAEREALQRFITSGGHVIATGALGGWFLSNTVRPNAMSSTWSRAMAAAPSAMTRAAPEITIAPRAAWSGGRAMPLYVLDDGEIVVNAVKFGSGEAVWCAAATPLTNAGLREPGDLEFFLAAIGPAGHRRILFDEYFHGVRRSLAATVWQSPAKWLLIQALLCAALVLWTYSRRSGPVMMPATESRLAALEFVRTVGSLYERAGAATIALESGARRVRLALARRLGVPVESAPDVLERLAAQHWRVDATGLADVLRACESARANDGVTSRQALPLLQALAARAASLNLFPPRPKE